MTSYFEAHHLITEVQSYGANIYADAGKVRVKGASKLPAPLLEKIKERRDDVLAVLTVPQLPWQLKRLVSAASSGVLNVEMRGVSDTARHVMALACDYLSADREKALSDLWGVYMAWQSQTEKN